MIEKVLEELEVVLRNSHEAIYKSLEPAATDDQLFELKETCFPGREIPQDLVSIFKWHNGQSGYGSLNPKDNRTFLPIAEVIDAWKFLNDPMEDIMEPTSKSWLPLAYNGAGDYLMLETSGPNEGAIIGYWHDDADRSIEWSTLQEWVNEVLRATKS